MTTGGANMAMTAAAAGPKSQDESDLNRHRARSGADPRRLASLSGARSRRNGEHTRGAVHDGRVRHAAPAEYNQVANDHRSGCDHGRRRVRTRAHVGAASAAAKAPGSAAGAVSVVAASVASRDVPIYLRGVGTVIPYNNVIVRSQITGQIVKISFVQGQTVKKGDVLAQIDPSPYQAQLDQAIANRDRDQAHLENARIDLNRYIDLAKQKSVAQQLANSQKAIVAQLVAMVKSDEAIIQSAKVNLGYTDLTSPIDGVTGIRQIDIGNIIHPTDVNGLVDVTQIEPISLIFTLPETDFARVQERMAQGPLTVFVDSQNGKTA